MATRGTRRFHSARIVIAVVAAITPILGGCDAARPEIGVVETVAPTPSYRPRPPETLPRLNDVLVLLAYSGPWQDQSERNRPATPFLTVFDDGLVVGDVAERPEDVSLRATRLTDGELADLRRLLDAADLEPFAAPSSIDGPACADCAVTIIQTDINGPTVEAAFYGLDTTLPPKYVASLPYAPEIIDLVRRLTELHGLVGEREPIVLDRDVPRIPAAPFSGG